MGIGGLTTTAINPDWSRAGELASLFQVALDSLLASIEKTLQSQLTTLGFHVASGSKPFKEILGRFVNANELGATDAVMFGVSAYSNDYSFVIDSSGVLAGGIFIKLIRSFTSEKRFEEMATTLRTDEEGVLRRLGLKLQ